MSQEFLNQKYNNNVYFKFLKLLMEMGKESNTNEPNKHYKRKAG